jgi:hypothetical protein
LIEGGATKLPTGIYKDFTAVTACLNTLAEFLQATATLMTSCPFPRMWSQPNPTEPAVPVHVAAPADAAAWLDADTHALLAREAPAAVGVAVKKELLAPMQQWLAAYDVAQVGSILFVLTGFYV